MVSAQLAFVDQWPGVFHLLCAQSQSCLSGGKKRKKIEDPTSDDSREEVVSFVLYILTIQMLHPNKKGIFFFFFFILKKKKIKINVNCLSAAFYLEPESAEVKISS